MAVPIALVQQALSALVSDPGSAGNGTWASPIRTAQANQTTLPALIMSLLSGPAFRDWLKLIAIGGFLELCRRTALEVYTTVYNWFFITVVFVEGDVSHSWMVVWLSEQPSWRNARDIQISTRTFGLQRRGELVPGEEDDDPSVMVRGERQVSRIPSHSSSHTFWYKNRWCQLSRLDREGGSNWGRTREEYLELCILSWDYGILNELLLEAKKAYNAAQGADISVHISDTDNEWRCLTTGPRRPLSTIVLDPEVKDLLLGDARQFLCSRNWYAARGIPFRRGYLLYGPPGTGKTSIIQSLAGELNLDIYIISLSRAGLDDNKLTQLVTDLPERCIALMEDIDAAFTPSLNRERPDTVSQPSRARQQEESKNSITLSGLLNALDGVCAQEGRLLFATTNKYDALDPALIRPGRMDLHIEFKLATRYQAKELYRCFYLPDSEVEATGNDLASEENWEKKKSTEKGSLLLDLETTSDEALSLPTPPNEDLPLTDIDHLDSKHSLTGTTFPSEAPVSTIPPASETEIPVTSLFHSHTSRSKRPKLSGLEVDRLAIMFAEILPEQEFSMATLQGYLMMYKTRPMAAVKELAAWIEKQRKEKREREVVREMNENENKKRSEEEAATNVSTAAEGSST